MRADIICLTMDRRPPRELWEALADEAVRTWGQETPYTRTLFRISETMLSSQDHMHMVWRIAELRGEE